MDIIGLKIWTGNRLARNARDTGYRFQLRYGLEAAAHELPSGHFKVILGSRFNFEIATGFPSIHTIGFY
jgi:hypothetical protein